MRYQLKVFLGDDVVNNLTNKFVDPVVRIRLDRNDLGSGAGKFDRQPEGVCANIQNALAVPIMFIVASYSSEQRFRLPLTEKRISPSAL